MSETTIRSAVIELGIRQLQAKLVPPDVAGILQAQKALDDTGVVAQRAAEVATREWGNFAITVREMQQELIRAGDTFEKVLADAVAWEDTLPRLANSTGSAARASTHHAGALDAQLKALGHLGHDSLIAARGVLFLMGANKEQTTAMLENLFVLQGVIDVTKGLGGALHELSKLYKEVTLAQLAMKAANPEFLAIAAVVGAVAAAGYSVYKAFTASSNALKELTEEFKAEADQSLKMVKLYEMQGEAASTLDEKLEALIHASGELATQRTRLAGLAEVAFDKGQEDEAAKLGEKALSLDMEHLRVYQLQADAKAKIIEHENKMIDKQLESLRLDQEADRLRLQRSAGMFGLGPEGRAKAQMLGSQTGNFRDVTKLSEEQIQFGATIPDENIQKLFQREQARRYEASPLAGMVLTAPRDPDTVRSEQIKGLEGTKRANDQKIEDIRDDFNRLADTLIKAMQNFQSRIDEFANAARAKASGRPSR